MLFPPLFLARRLVVIAALTVAVGGLCATRGETKPGNGYPTRIVLTDHWYCCGGTVPTSDMTEWIQTKTTDCDRSYVCIYQLIKGSENVGAWNEVHGDAFCNRPATVFHLSPPGTTGELSLYRSGAQAQVGFNGPDTTWGYCHDPDLGDQPWPFTPGVAFSFQWHGTDTGSGKDYLGEPIPLNWHYHMFYDLVANPGGPYNVLRGARVHLDGSASSPRRIIKSYSWHFKAQRGAGCSAPPKAGHKAGERTSAVILCSVTVTLTVTDGRRTDTRSTDINVTPRPWQTPVRHLETVRGGGRYWDPPRFFVCGPGGRDVCAGGTFGENVSGCPHARLDTPDLICPLFGLRHTWEENGYTLTQVRDSGGPFEDYWYPRSATLTIDRKALLNPYLYHGSPQSPYKEAPDFYTFNLARGTDLSGFLNAVEVHEAWGVPGMPHSGHTSAMREAVTANDGEFDPRKNVEEIFRTQRKDAVRQIDRTIKALQTYIDDRSADPLATIWGPASIYFWSPLTKSYDLADDIQVGGSE